VWKQAVVGQWKKRDGQMYNTISINNLVNIITRQILDFNAPSSNVACQCTMAFHYTMLADLSQGGHTFG